MLQTCEITLTPNSDGSYQEVKSCALSAIGSSGVSSGSGAVAAPADPIVVIVSVHFGRLGYYDDRELYSGLALLHRATSHGCGVILDLWV